MEKGDMERLADEIEAAWGKVLPDLKFDPMPDDQMPQVGEQLDPLTKPAGGWVWINGEWIHWTQAQQPRSADAGNE